MKRRRVHTVLFLLMVGVIGSSCRSPRVDTSGIAEDSVPERFGVDDGMPAAGERWWREFAVDELNRLVEQVLTHNTGLARAAARLEQARAVARKQGASRMPTLNAEVSSGVTERGEPLSPGGDTRTEPSEVGLAASYEVDLWGRISQMVDMAELEWAASREDWRALQISVSAQAVLSYLDLVATRQSLDTVLAQLKTSRQVADLVELRFRRSQATALDVLQQRENVAAVEALIPALEMREALALNALTILCGLPVGSNLGLEARRLPGLPTMPSKGIPLELVGRRPDVRAVRARLDSAQLGVRVAEADRLPALRLTASAGYSSTDVSDLFDNWLARLAGNLLAPLLDGGRRRAEVERTRAVVDQWVASYRESLLEAIREVEDAGVRETRQGELLDALRTQLGLARQSREEAQARYGQGVESFLSVLTALGSVQQLERRLTEAEYNRLTYRVQLYRALSGGWSGMDAENKEEVSP